MPHQGLKQRARFAAEFVPWSTKMKLIDLLESARCGPGQTPASKGFCFPKTIELPQQLRTYLLDTWEKSEHKREEVGGNLSLKIGLSLPPKDNRIGWQKFAKVEFMQ